NELAQSEGATGKPFVHVWMHCAHLRVNGEKMSKSLGNFFTLRDLFARGYAGRELRYVLLNGHYRQPLNFTFDAVEAARTSLARIDEFVDRLRETAASTPADPELPGWVAEIQRQFCAALSDDLNVPEALAALFALVREGNSAMQNGSLRPSEAAATLAQVMEMDGVLGLISFGRRNARDLPADVTALLEARGTARQAKNWTESDRLRDEMARLGWEVRDGKDGQKVKKL
ncbi:MAG: CysS/YqeB C-terminal domain-containing protein, partial [Kiritimatiellia bacterium]